MSAKRDETPSYVYRCDECKGLLGAAVADLLDDVCMKNARDFKRDAQRRGRTVEVMAVSDVRTADWCRDGGRHAKQGALL